MNIIRISPHRAEVRELFKRSDEYMGRLYPAESNHLEDAETLSQPNVFFLGAFDGDLLAGIGAVKCMLDDVAYGEIKRLFVLPQYRGKGVSKLIMADLETHLQQQEIFLARLETGIHQPEAIGLYRALGYRERPPFGSYRLDPLSLFMEKELY